MNNNYIETYDYYSLMEFVSSKDIKVYNEILTYVNTGFKNHNIGFMNDHFMMIAERIIKNVDDFKNKYSNYKSLNPYNLIKEKVDCMYLPSYKVTKVDLNTNEETVLYLQTVIDKVDTLINKSELCKDDLLIIYYHIELFFSMLGYNLDDEIDYKNGVKPYPVFGGK